MLRVFLSILAWTLLSAGQEPRLPDELSEEQRARQERILRIARSVQPEFGADLLLRFATKDVNRSHSRRLLEDAFQLAGWAAVQHPFFFGGGRLDSLAGAQVRGSGQLKIDRLSLRLRAVDSMLVLDPGAAREMFTSIDLPVFSPRRCDSVLLYNFEEYYRIFRKVTELGYTPAEIGKELHLEPWRTHLRSVTTAAQLRRIAIELTHFNISVEQRSRLVDALAMGIDSLPADSQHFLDKVETVLGPFEPLLRKIDGAARNVLLRALKSFALRHLTTEVCLLPGSGVSRRATGTQGMNRVVKVLNPLIRSFASDPSLTVLTLEDYEPRVAAKFPETIDFWSSSESKILLRELQALKSAPDKESTEWREQFRALAAKVSEWKGEQEPSSVVFYCEKSNLLLAMLNIPSGGLTGATLFRDPASYYGSQPSIVRSNRGPVDSLFELAAREDAVRRNYPSLWLRPVLELFEITAKHRSSERELIRSALGRQNSSIVLVAYFELLLGD